MNRKSKFKSWRLAFIYCNLLFLYKKRRNFLIRRYWVKSYLRDRNIWNGRTLFLRFKQEDHEEFQRFTRLSVQQFDLLHSMVKRKLEKFCKFREPLSSEIRLASVIHMLAHGNSIKVNAWLFQMGRSTMQNILVEVCQALVECLTPIYVPNLNRDTWEKIALQFEKQWQCPNCIGALDGYHVWLQKPPNSGSVFFNYKKFFSIVMLGLCDAFRRFTWFNVGHYGSFNDASIFMSTDLYKKMHQGTLDLPPPSKLKGTNIVMPYFMVADGIFALHNHLMKPFSQSPMLSDKQKIYNARIARARINIECAFGILSQRWRILGMALPFKLKTCELIVITTILLHNFIITENLKGASAGGSYYSAYTHSGRGRNGIDEVDDRELENSNIQRRQLMDYFSSPQGRVPWQDNYT